MRTRPIASLILLLSLVFAFQGSRGIYTPDEGYYVSIAQAMAQTGDYLIPRLHHEPWLDKPPLSLWGIAAGIKIFGQNEWGARAFHGLSLVLTTLLVFLLGTSLGGKRRALLGAVIYVTMIIPFVAANVATPDAPLVLWTTLTFFCFWKSVRPNAQHVSLWKMLMCAAFGLGFLTKGPAAIVPSGAMFLYLLIQQRTWRYFLTPWAIVGVALFSVLGLSWYAYVSRHLPGAMEYFLDNQLLGRTVSSKYARNPGLKGAFIYLPVVILGTLPWSYFWIGYLKAKGKKVFQKTSWNNLKSDPVRLFLALWIAAPLAVLCLASSKLPLYALPIFPALALATARLLPQAVDKPWRNNPLGFSRKAIILLGIWILTLPVIKFAVSAYPHEKDMRTFYTALKDHLPETPYEIVALEEHLEGLGFYCNANIVRVTTDKTPYPFFVLPEHLNDKIAELPSSNYAHLFICHEERDAKKIRSTLQSSGIQFREEPLPFDNFLITVDAMK